MTETRVFKCVPLDNNWIIPGTKADLKAMYLRPRRSVGEYDEIVPERSPEGLPLYDLCGPLPLRRHADWTAKGYLYLTVVASPRNAEDPAWGLVVGSLRAKNLEPRDYLQHPVFGTWNPKLYLATAHQVDLDKFGALRALVEQLGSDTVLAVKQSDDPTFTLPPALQGIPPGGKMKTLGPPAQTETTSAAAGSTVTVSYFGNTSIESKSVAKRKAVQRKAKPAPVASEVTG